MQVGSPKGYVYEGKEWFSAITKTRAEGSLFLSTENLLGDQQADLEHHGGPDKAVCVYCWEHYPYWEEKLDRKLEAAAFGENFTVEGLTEDLVRIGDIFRVGKALVQVSQPRQPCYKLRYKHHAPELPLEIQKTGYTGYYLRVLEEGFVQAGDMLDLVEPSPYGVTVSFANRIMYQEKSNTEGLLKVLSVQELSASWRDMLTKRIQPAADV